MSPVPPMHPAEAEAIAALFKGKLDATEQRSLHAHLAQCSNCKRIYNRYAEAERVLSSSSDFPLLSQDRIEARLLGAPVRPPRWRNAVFVGAFVTVSLASMVVLVPRGSTSESLTARGSGERVSANVSLRAMALKKGESGALEVVDLGTGALRAGDRLQVLATSFDEARWARAFARIADGRMIALGEAQRLEAGTEDRPLAALEIPADWSAGKLEVIAVYGATAAELDQAGAIDLGRARVVTTRLEAAP